MLFSLIETPATSVPVSSLFFNTRIPAEPLPTKPLPEISLPSMVIPLAVAFARGRIKIPAPPAAPVLLPLLVMVEFTMLMLLYVPSLQVK